MMFHAFKAEWKSFLINLFIIYLGHPLPPRAQQRDVEWRRNLDNYQHRSGRVPVLWGNGSNKSPSHTSTTCPQLTGNAQLQIIHSNMCFLFFPIFYPSSMNNVNPFLVERWWRDCDAWANWWELQPQPLSLVRWCRVKDYVPVSGEHAVCRARHLQVQGWMVVGQATN